MLLLATAISGELNPAVVVLILSRVFTFCLLADKPSAQLADETLILWRPTRVCGAPWSSGNVEARVHVWGLVSGW